VEFVLDLLQGLGIAAAVGIRPFLPALLVGALATGDLGIDFDGTSFAFLEQAPFLAGMLVLMALSTVAMRRIGPAALEAGPAMWALLAISVAVGALMAAGSLADRDYPILPGIVGGVLAAVLGFFAAKSLFSRVRRRLDRDSQAVLPAYGEGAGLVGAGLSVLFPPLAILLLGALAWLLMGGRRRAGEKYAGLRILR
jgi:hypothetical protein